MFKILVNVGPNWLPIVGRNDRKSALLCATGACKRVERAKGGLVLVLDGETPLTCWRYGWEGHGWEDHSPTQWASLPSPSKKSGKKIPSGREGRP